MTCPEWKMIVMGKQGSQVGERPDSSERPGRHGFAIGSKKQRTQTWVRRLDRVKLET